MFEKAIIILLVLGGILVAYQLLNRASPDPTVTMPPTPHKTQTSPFSSPSGFTDDISIHIFPECTIDELVDIVIEMSDAQSSRSMILAKLVAKFGLSYPDARLAMDRVAGGQIRAKASSAENRPDPNKDLVAFISYQRAKGVKAPPKSEAKSRVWMDLIGKMASPEIALAWIKNPEFLQNASVSERQAAELWARPIEGHPDGIGTTQSTTVALLMTELALAMQVKPKDRQLLNVCLQARAAVSGAGENLIENRPACGYVIEGTSAWFEALHLSQAAEKLHQFSHAIEDPEAALSALNIRGRIVTSLLGHCHEKVGEVMLASIRQDLITGDKAAAITSCESLIADFEIIVERNEGHDSQLLDEDEIALRQMAEALNILVSLQDKPEWRQWQKRCVNLLTPKEEITKPTSRTP